MEIFFFLTPSRKGGLSPSLISPPPLVCYFLPRFLLFLFPLPAFYVLDVLRFWTPLPPLPFRSLSFPVFSSSQCRAPLSPSLSLLFCPCFFPANKAPLSSPSVQVKDLRNVMFSKSNWLPLLTHWPVFGPIFFTPFSPLLKLPQSFWLHSFRLQPPRPSQVPTLMMMIYSWLWPHSQAFLFPETADQILFFLGVHFSYTSLLVTSLLSTDIHSFPLFLFLCLYHERKLSFLIFPVVYKSHSYVPAKIWPFPPPFLFSPFFPSLCCWSSLNFFHAIPARLFFLFLFSLVLSCPPG